jgi:hypothetical protein
MLELHDGATPAANRQAFALLQGATALSSLTLAHSTWSRYIPETLAKAIGPLMLLLHRTQQEAVGNKPRDVLAGLQLRSRPLRDKPFTALYRMRDEIALEFDSELKVAVMMWDERRRMMWVHVQYPTLWRM